MLLWRHVAHFGTQILPLNVRRANTPTQPRIEANLERLTMFILEDSQDTSHRLRLADLDASKNAPACAHGENPRSMQHIEMSLRVAFEIKPTDDGEWIARLRFYDGKFWHAHLCRSRNEAARWLTEQVNLHNKTHIDVGIILKIQAERDAAGLPG
jgi:hypothetical protein